MESTRISQKGLHLEVTRMYRKTNPNQMVFEFHIPFGGKLRSDNRWVILSQQIPWDQIESQYAGLFEESHLGCPAKSSRIALGALIIKERMQTTDRETVEQIRENPYLQFFLGFPGYTDKEPFHHTSMVHFMERPDDDGANDRSRAESRCFAVALSNYRWVAVPRAGMPGRIRLERHLLPRPNPPGFARQRG